MKPGSEIFEFYIVIIRERCRKLPSLLGHKRLDRVNLWLRVGVCGRVCARVRECSFFCILIAASWPETLYCKRVLLPYQKTLQLYLRLFLASFSRKFAHRIITRKKELEHTALQLTERQYFDASAYVTPADQVSLYAGKMKAEEVPTSRFLCFVPRRLRFI